MGKMKIINLILLCSVYVVHSKHQPNNGRHNSHQKARISIPHLNLGPQCRFVCDNGESGRGQSNNQNGHLNLNPFEIFQNLSSSFNNGLENPSSLVGILLDGSNSYSGFLHRFSNLIDIIQGFPNSNGILLSTLQRLQGNRYFETLLRRIGVPHGSLEGAGNETNLRVQELFQRLPFLSGISSTPFGIIFHSFPAHIQKEFTSGINNPSEALSRVSALFAEVPFLSGIYVRLQEFLNQFNTQGGESGNPVLTFLGSERFLEYIETLINSSISQYHNLNPSEASNITFIEILVRYLNESGIAQRFPGLDSNRLAQVFIHMVDNLRGMLTNSSALKNLQEGPLVIRDIPQLIRQWIGRNASENLNIGALYSILDSPAALPLEIAIFRALNPSLHGESGLGELFHNLPGEISSGSLNNPSLFLNILQRALNFSQNGDSGRLDLDQLFHNPSLILSVLQKTLNPSQNASSRPDLRELFNNLSNEISSGSNHSPILNILNELQSLRGSNGAPTNLPDCTANITQTNDRHGKIHSTKLKPVPTATKSGISKHKIEKHHGVKGKRTEHETTAAVKPTPSKAPPASNGNIGGTGVGGTGVGGAGPDSSGTGGTGQGGRNAKLKHGKQQQKMNHKNQH